ncbi:hypothetical protein G3N56_05610 [Desulfovibrio sulfodismutans]|uniref:Uncharacterized protein n=1 Tax=Desulfolutivibrio sulfodismutans TaxID=63561 RepID=A0A7K3NK92_9BACT|nr:hypothetical protein [Desulfolutivibrio sulfodismutans]NDY56223.1 hypothetical protein [Desulfolutivibrio sulfodismutans]QLA11283.1 hypothetical protein GD606_02810 [Desulfolutivibrio sulfodismutans DSM 3696]
MKERPILFSAPMVLGNRAGRKTQTRRVMRVQPPDSHTGRWTFCVSSTVRDDIDRWSFMVIDPQGAVFTERGRETCLATVRSPHLVGDRLWVRETFWQAGSYPCGLPSGEPQSLASCRGPLIHYAADGNPPDTPNRHYPTGLGGVHHFSAPDPYAMWEKRPSIHMPRGASRNTYEVVAVRPQRLLDITPADVAAEGLVRLSKDGRIWKWGLPDRDGLPGTDDHGWPWSEWRDDPVRAYLKLWDQINAARGFGSDKNPWVWAISYRDITAKAKAEAA